MIDPRRYTWLPAALLLIAAAILAYWLYTPNAVRVVERVPGLDDPLGMKKANRSEVNLKGDLVKGEGTPADLDEHRVECTRAPGRHELPGDLPTDRAAPVKRQCVLRSLHGERNRPSFDRFSKPEHRRITCGVTRTAFATVDTRVEAVEFGAKSPT